MTKRTDKRTTVSLAEVVWQMAESQMRAKGFNDNFSAYIADLIRRDKERAEELEMEKARLAKGERVKGGNPGSYPSHTPQYMVVEEDKPAAKPKKPKAA